MRRVWRVSTGMCVLLLAFVFCAIADQMYWSTSTETYIYDSSGIGNDKLLAGTTNTAGFMQLIQDADGGGIGFDPSQPNGIPLGSSDNVVDKSWIGEFTATDGTFFHESNVATNIPYVIRVFDSPSGDWDAGLIPTSGYYGDHAAYTPLLPAANIYYVENMYTDTLIPEPTTVSLFGLGVCMLVLRWRRRK
ncbi:MAG: PEP-CTERM sorting domain-containing protein [Kiritimatiellae bacterium]|nr:PEP-CTERM sorting domain-containing protein [Kiritimatiellia bacterium]